MKKSFFIFGTIALLASMLVASVLNTNLGFELIMSGSFVHNVARVLLIIAFVLLAVTTRPRPAVVRGILASVSVIVTVTALSMAANYALPLLDALVYLASSTVLLLEALEGEAVSVTEGDLVLRKTIQA